MCACFGLVWNPKQDRSFDPREIGELIGRRYRVKQSWRMRSRKTGIGPGDQFFLFRVGIEPRGVIGFGEITSSPRRGGVDILHDLIVDADTVPDDVLPMKCLVDRFPGRVYANVQGSGFRITERESEYIIREWGRRLDSPPHPIRLPAEREVAAHFNEGATVRVSVDRHERDPRARAACIAEHGCQCVACGFDFEAIYGELGRGYVEVHHLELLSRRKRNRRTSPTADLRPLCANCHAMIHRSDDPDRPLSIAQLRRCLRAAEKAKRSPRR